MTGVPEFEHQDLLPIGPDDTPYRLLTTDGVSTFDTPEGRFVKVEPEALTLLTREAMRDIAHLLRPGHLRQLRSILDDPEASPNDRFVALDLLKNASIAAGGVLPMCQDTGTAIVKGKRGQHVLTRGGDNLAILRAFEFCRPGDVMVVDAGGDVTNAVIGGILSFYAATAGLAGMVIDGAIRDVAEIRERTFPVYARGVNHRGPYKDGPGAINVPVTVGGMVVRPGDVVVGDQDGLLAFAPEAAAALIEKARAQHLKEEATMQAMREGRWDRSFIDALEARCAN